MAERNGKRPEGSDELDLLLGMEEGITSTSGDGKKYREHKLENVSFQLNRTKEANSRRLLATIRAPWTLPESDKFPHGVSAYTEFGASVPHQSASDADITFQAMIGQGNWLDQGIPGAKNVAVTVAFPEEIPITVRPTSETLAHYERSKIYDDKPEVAAFMFMKLKPVPREDGTDRVDVPFGFLRKVEYDLEREVTVDGKKVTATEHVEHRFTSRSRRSRNGGQTGQAVEETEPDV